MVGLVDLWMLGRFGSKSLPSPADGFQTFAASSIAQSDQSALPRSFSSALRGPRGGLKRLNQAEKMSDRKQDARVRRDMQT